YKRLLLLFSICLSTFCFIQTSHAQDTKTQQPPKDAAIFKFKDGETYDFGTIEIGPEAPHTFEFTNVGNQPLFVTGVTPSCGCTHVDWDKQPIAPGQKGHISLNLITTEQKGFFKKEVYIQTNAYIPNGDRRYTIYIKGNAVKKK
ncbi:MAG: DUF1573 domain-containing protein, partial [Chitinophagia bacterium]|nr:DUF1573 domain-containing protein [Chitinophagia bacterium]